MIDARNPDLEEQILESPDDPAAYLVYADWLQSRGDPRGKLIAAQAAKLAAAEAAILDAHHELRGPDGARLEWHLGFWRSLSLGNVQSNEEVARALASPSARFLREVHISGLVDRRVLGLLASLHRTLEEIDVVPAADQFHNDELLALAACTGLRRLCLGACAPISERGLAALRAMPRLAELELRACPLWDASAAALAGVPLTHVRFDRVAHAFGAAGMRALAAAPLVSLALRAEGTIDDDCIAPLAAHPTLVNFESPDLYIHVAGATVLGTLPRLRRLYIPSSSVDDAAVLALARGASTLRSLTLGHCKYVGDDACAAIAQLPELTLLDVGATAVGPRGIRHLAGARALEHLDLSFLELGDSDVVELAGHANLRSLSLAYARRVTDAALDVLVKLRTLERLDLAGTAITTHAIDRLATLPNLTELGLQDCDDEVIDHARTITRWYPSTHDLLGISDHGELY